MKALFVPLHTEFFNAFNSGEKTHELREYGPRWNEETCAIGRRVRLRKGYSGPELWGEIVSFQKVWGQDLPISDREAVTGCYGSSQRFIAKIGVKLDKWPSTSQSSK